jgi:NAD-dependent deacetylase
MEQEITANQLNQLKCPNCGSILRPNILWFDELYNERLYKLDSSLRIAKHTGLLLTVGTSGATNLPNQLVAQTLHYGGSIIDINIEEGHFSKLAMQKKNGYTIKGNSSEVLPQLVAHIREVILN